MSIKSDTTQHADPFDLHRFVDAQNRHQIYEDAITELRNGRKESHWMWYIFPQFDGLGFSSTSKMYAIKSMDEARAYLQHPELGKRLRECVQAILKVQGRTASQIFGSPDDMKLKSSMTLFEAADQSESLFAQVLDKYFQAQRDEKTLSLIEHQNM